MYMNPATSVSLPVAFETVTFTVPNPAGVTAFKAVELTNVTDAAGTPPKSIAVPLVKLVPARVTVSPPNGVPLLGESEVKTGGLL